MDNPEALLIHARFLRALTRALVVDDARAEDLVQETWLAAVRRPPVEGDLRAWLARVLRNAATTQRRRDSRRADRERRSARRESLPSAADIVEKEDLARRVADAVFRLEEPYRRAILHRFYEDLPPREIARLEGIPVETVRTRLKRGLERLRRTLDRDFGGARSAWCIPLAAAWGEGLAGTPTGATIALTKAAQLGGLLMSGKLTAFLSSVIVLVAMGSGYLWVQLDSERELSVAASSQRDDLAGQVTALEKDLDESRRRREETDKQLAAAQRAHREAIVAAREAGESAAERPEPAAPVGDKPLPGIAEARSVAEDLFRKGDLEGMWLLGIGLLGHGEEGFAKVIELATLLDGEDGKAMIDSHLWSEEELYAGSFLGTAFSHHEALLRFGLYLHQQDSESLPRSLAGLTLRFDPHLSATLLGYYAGDDPEILSGYLDLYREQLEAYGNQQRWPSEARSAIHNLAQIQTEESTGYLIELLDRVPPNLKSVIVQSLAWQRGPKALEALRDLNTTTLDKHTRGIVAAAVRLLE